MIGDGECPILYRLTLIDAKRFKVMVHRFVPDAGREDFHDHPRSFVTFVVRGGYDDITPCVECLGSGRDCTGDYVMDLPCLPCDGSGKVVERVRAFAVRRRSAAHTHMTAVHPDGAWSLVVMGPFVRPWGFLRAGQWFGFREYEERFGKSFRCG